MLHDLPRRLARLLVAENRPLSVAYVGEKLRVRDEEYLTGVVNILTFQNIISQFELRGQLYIALNCPFFATGAMHEHLTAYLSSFMQEHYRGLIARMDAIAAELRRE